MTATPAFLPVALRLAAVATVFASAGAALLAAADRVPVWEPFELELIAHGDLAHPYVDGLRENQTGLVVATFRGESGEAVGRELTVTGFWDGDRTWRVRFAPPLPGEWSYRTASADPGLDGSSGRLVATARTPEECAANPVVRGFVRVADSGPRPGRHFVYADGTPMLWIGDTWWDWAKPGIRWETMKKLVDDRAAKGFNVGQLFIGGRGWGRGSGYLNEDFTEPDVERLRRIERFIRYANSKGITVWVHGWWASDAASAQGSLRDAVGGENIRRWWRYLVHRLGAYNVIWTIAGEYNKFNYSGLDINFWKRVGALIDAEDPYERLISGHPTPPTYRGGMEGAQWSTADLMHEEPWLRYNQSQTGHSTWTDEMIPWVVARDYARLPAKPIVVTEACYEFILDNPPASQVRLAAWAAVLSGAAGHTYGGGHVWRAHTPETPTGIGAWPMDPSFENDTLDYPGARSVAFMGRFLREIPWWTLEPHPELIHEYPSQLCAARPGEEYVAFLRYGGRIKLDLRDTPPGSRFRFRWIDPAAGTIGDWQEAEGGGVREFRSPFRGRIGEFDHAVVHVSRLRSDGAR